jgi:hypothetical protein
VLVSYDGKPMIRATYNNDGSYQSRAAIYYILDANLHANAGTVSNVVATFWNGRQWGHGGLHVLEMKNGYLLAPFATSVVATMPNGWVGTGGNCGGSASRCHSVTFSTTGPSGPSTYANSLVFAVLAGRAATAATMSAASGLTEVWNQQQPTPNNHLGAAAWVIDSDTRSVSWSVSNCYNSAVALIAVQRLTAPP